VKYRTTQEEWLQSIQYKSKPLFIEIWKNASRFTDFLCQSVKMENPPTFAVVRNPYERFWSSCKEIYPDKDFIVSINKGLSEIKSLDPDFHFATQTWFKELYPWKIDYVFKLENLNKELKTKCNEFNVVWKDAFSWDRAMNINLNVSDHTNNKIAIQYIKGLSEVKYFYEEDFEWYEKI